MLDLWTDLLPTSDNWGKWYTSITLARLLVKILFMFLKKAPLSVATWYLWFELPLKNTSEFGFVWVIVRLQTWKSVFLGHQSNKDTYSLIIHGCSFRCSVFALWQLCSQGGIRLYFGGCFNFNYTENEFSSKMCFSSFFWFCFTGYSCQFDYSSTLLNAYRELL